MSGDPDESRTGRQSAAADQSVGHAAPRDRPRRAGRRLEAMKRRYAESSAERVWRRLETTDFINRGMLFAAVLLVCLVPFVIILQALVGQSAATGLVRRFGLSHDAANDVGRVFTSPSDTSGAIKGLSWVFFVLGGIAAAAAIQELYEHAFDVEGRGVRDTPRRIVWLLALVGAAGLAAWAQPWLHDVGGPVLVGVVVLPTVTAFWWFTMWLLLGGRLSWGELFPSALATGLCWLGMEIVFRLTMSSTITSNYAKYGSIGVVFAIMSFLIAVGVVIILGAVFGVVWRERQASRSSAPSDLNPA